MTISEHPAEFGGKPIREFEYDEESVAEYGPDSVFDFGKYTPRLALEWDEAEDGAAISSLIEKLCELPGAAALDALVIGFWGGMDDDSSDTVAALVAYRDKLPNLKALFLGDITFEENEISWINQSDLSALWPSYPKLEHIQVRGGNNLTLGRIASPVLKTLIVESGGLPRGVVRDALDAETPNLEHLELWLGSENYGATSTVADFQNLFSGNLFPKLKTLALRDCEYADDLAAALAQAPLLARIETLDLSLGNLSDKGAEALLASPHVAKLKKLDLHHHYIGDPAMERLKALGPEVELSDREKADEDGDRYIAVSE
jgi:hypothetical protein